jgi:hypothetical protein
MKTGVLAVIFPMDIAYIYQYFDSLCAQSYTDFDVIVINDGYVNLESILRKYASLKISVQNYTNTPAKIREFGINYMIMNNYEVLIFTDVDDYIADNRVERVLSKLNNCDIVVNDLTLFNDAGILHENYISNRLANNTHIDIEYIRQKNLFGLSNSAVKITNLHPFSIPETITVADWYIFSYLLTLGMVAIFTTETNSFYRRHGSNQVEIGNYSNEALLTNLQIKKTHYYYMKNVAIEYKELFDKTVDLVNRYSNSPGSIKLEKNNNYPLWWEETEVLYENC